MRLCAAPMLPCPRICPMQRGSRPWRMPCRSMGAGSPVLAVHAWPTALDGRTPWLAPILPESRLRRCCWCLRRHGSLRSPTCEQDLAAALRLQRLRERFLECVEWVDLLHGGPERSLSDEVAQLLVHLPDFCARKSGRCTSSWATSSLRERSGPPWSRSTHSTHSRKRSRSRCNRSAAARSCSHVGRLLVPCLRRHQQQRRSRLSGSTGARHGVIPSSAVDNACTA